MKNEKTPWSKEELKVSISLLCAKADDVTQKEETIIIPSKTDKTTYDRMSKNIIAHEEGKSLRKIQKHLVHHHYSHRELTALRKEMDEIFLADNVLKLKEQSVDKILGNILY